MRRAQGGPECPGGRADPLYWHWLGPGNTNKRWVGYTGYTGWVLPLPTRYTLPVVPSRPQCSLHVHSALNRRFEVGQGDPRGG